MTKNKKRKNETSLHPNTNNNGSGPLSPPPPPPPPPNIPEGWDRCHAYNAQKKRFCRQQPIPTKSTSFEQYPLYCGNHQHLRQQQEEEQEQQEQQDYCRPAGVVEDVEDDPSSSTNNNNNNNNIKNKNRIKRNRKRIPCPIDPSHFIFEDMVQKHILICPRLKRTRMQQEQVYYQRNCNCGGHGSGGGIGIGMAQEENKDATDQSINDLAWAQRVAWRVLQVYAQLFEIPSTTKEKDSDHETTITGATAAAATSRTFARTMTGLQIHQALPLEDYSSQELNAGLLQGIESYRIKSGGARHLPQLASLMGHLRAIDVLPPLLLDKKDSGMEKEMETKEENAPPITPPSTTPATKLEDASSTTPPISKDQTSNDGLGRPGRNRRRLVLLEMGAGRGIFGLAAAGVAAAATAATAAVPATSTATATTSSSTTRTTSNDSSGSNHRKVHLAMVERAGSRGKADTVLRTLPSAQRPTQPAASTTTTATTNTAENTSRPLLLETSTADNDNGAGTINTTMTNNSNNNKNQRQSHPYLQLEPIEWSRLICDLAHVHLPTVLEQIKINKKKVSTTNIQKATTTDGTKTTIDMPASNDRNENENENEEDNDQEEEDEVVVIAKHLCGVGTDLALKSMEPIRHQVSAVVMATCCHGICNWNDYVGRDYLTQIMTETTRNGDSHDLGKKDINTTNNNNNNKECAFRFGPEEFELVRRWSAGTVVSPSLGVATGTEAPAASEAGRSGHTTTSEYQHSAQAMDQKQEEEEQQRGEEEDALPRDTTKGDKKVGDDDDDDEGHGNTVESVTSGVVDVGVGVATVVQSLSLACGVQGLGRACQRLIDYGRCEYLNQVIFSNDGPHEEDHNKIGDDIHNVNHRNSKGDLNTNPARLCVYVPPDVTPQNAILIARRSRTNCSADRPFLSATIENTGTL